MDCIGSPYTKQGGYARGSARHADRPAPDGADTGDQRPHNEIIAQAAEAAFTEQRAAEWRLSHAAGFAYVEGRARAAADRGESVDLLEVISEAEKIGLLDDEPSFETAFVPYLAQVLVNVAPYLEGYLIADTPRQARTGQHMPS